MGGGQRVDGVLRDQVKAVGGVGEDADAAGFDRQRFGADREVDRGCAELGEPADLVDAGLGVVPAAVGDDVDGTRAAAVVHLEAGGAGDDRGARGGGGAPGAGRGGGGPR